jgi:Na+/H+ antiporter NhaC
MIDGTALGPFSLLPPLLAILLAIWSKQVYPSLFLGIWLAWTILADWNPVAGLVQTVDGLVGVFADPDRAMIIMLTVMIGALLTLTQFTGGMSGFVDWVTRRGIVATRRSAGLLAWALALVIMVESTIGILVSGAVTRPLFDRLGMSRERLSYILDAMCSPKTMLIPLNTFGAYVLGLLITQGVESPVALLAAATPLNFYAILAVGSALFVGMTDGAFGPMAKADRRVREEGKVLRDGAEPLVAGEALSVPVKSGITPSPLNLLLPVAAMVVALPVLLIVTGQGNLTRGNGSASAFWAVLIGLSLGAVMYRARGMVTLGEITDMFMKGVGGMVPVGLLLVLAFGIGDACQALGTGPFVARAAEAGLSPAVIPVALFVTSGITSFATGTSFGTWAIMIPIVVPMTALIDLPPGLAVAAVLSGGLFGDHASPISDSTIIATMAAGTDHIDHVRTQLPYALVLACISMALFFLSGIVL